MEMINNLKEIFSNRELATFVWVAIIIILINIKKEIRRSIFQIIKAFFVKQILDVVLFLAVYTFFIVLVLKYFRFWDLTLLKDTMFWFVGFLFMMLFNLNKATDRSFFWKILKDSFKVTIFLEFFLNFYTFSFFAEMIVLPVFTFIFLMNVVAETKNDYMPVAKLTKWILGFVGLYYLIFAVYKFIFYNDNILSVHNLSTIVLPVQLSVLSIPFFYLISLYSNYERLFLRVKFMNDDPLIQRKLKAQILKKANFSINKLREVDEKLTGFNLLELRDINEKDDISSKL